MLALLQSIQNLIHPGGGEVLIVDVIHLHHGGAATGRQTLLLALEVDAPVGGALTHLDAEPVLDVGEDVVATPQHAGYVGAYRYAVAAHGLQLEHGVEARHLVDGDGGHLQIRRHGIHQGGGEVTTVLVLHLPQGSQHRGLFLIVRIAGEPAVYLLPGVGRQDCVRGGRHQRSISPNTMSWVPMTATTSASMLPWDISFMEARWAKPGALTLTR